MFQGVLCQHFQRAGVQTCLVQIHSVQGGWVSFCASAPLTAEAVFSISPALWDPVRGTSQSSGVVASMGKLRELAVVGVIGTMSDLGWCAPGTLGRVGLAAPQGKWSS